MILVLAKKLVLFLAQWWEGHLHSGCCRRCLVPLSCTVRTSNLILHREGAVRDCLLFPFMHVHIHTHTHTLNITSLTLIFIGYFRNRAGKTSDGLYDIPRKDNLAVKQITPCSSSDEDESGAVYAIPRPSTNSDIPDGLPDADSVKTLDSSSEHTHVTTPTKDRRSPPHQKNGHVQSVKKIPLIPRKVITKSGSDNEEPFKSKHNYNNSQDTNSCSP